MRRSLIAPLIASVLLCSACGGSNHEEPAEVGGGVADGGAANVDEPKAGGSEPKAAEAKADGGEAKVDGGGAKAEGALRPELVAVGTLPKGRSAAGNDESILATLPALEVCTWNTRTRTFDDCEGLDAFMEAVEELREHNALAVDRTLINLLGEEEEIIRYACLEMLGGAWVEDDALVAMMFAALGVERIPRAAAWLALEIGDGLHVEKLYGKFLPNLKAALLRTPEPEAFDCLAPKEAVDCADVEACADLLMAVAKGSPDLDIRSRAALLLFLEYDDAEACEVAANLVVELSEQPFERDDEADFHPHLRASGLIDRIYFSILGETDARAEACAAATPGMVEALTPHVAKGPVGEQLIESVFELGHLWIEERSGDEKVLEAFATAVAGNGQLSKIVRGWGKLPLD